MRTLRHAECEIPARREARGVLHGGETDAMIAMFVDVL